MNTIYAMLSTRFSGLCVIRIQIKTNLIRITVKSLTSLRIVLNFILPLDSKQLECITPV